MRRQTVLCIALLATAASPGIAAAQDPPPDPEGPIAEPDIPDSPPEGDAITVDDLEEGGTRAVKKLRFTKKTYPIEAVRRPLTLAAAQAEISLDSPFLAGTDSPTIWQVLRARYGITRDLEAGITYSFGLLNLSPPEGAETFEPGKGFSFDGAYTLWPEHLAVQASLPFYVDPDAFGMGFNLGIPFRVNLGSRWAIYGGQDLLQVRIVKMPVDPANPGYNLAIVAASAGGGEEPRGNLAINLGGMYQYRPNIVTYVTMGFRYLDFEDTGAPVSFFGGATWSRHNRLDLGGRIGFFDMDTTDSFSLSVYAAYRL